MSSLSPAGLFRLILSALLVHAIGCGAGNTATSAPDEVVDLSTLPPAPDLTFYVYLERSAGEFGQPVVRGLTQAMISAGYQVSDDRSRQDVIVKLRLSAEKVKATVWNGMKGGFKVKVDVDFVARDKSRMLDQVTTEFVAKSGVVDDNALKRVLVHVGATGKVDAYAAERKTQAAADEASMWKAADVEGCKSASTKSACDGVKNYLSRHATGQFAADAALALRESETAREENTWRAASAEQCKKPSKSDDCAKVDRYLEAYPTGKYAAEATAALAASGKARSALKKQEEAKAKIADREECIKDCRRKYEAYTSFDAVVGRCVQNNCD